MPNYDYQCSSCGHEFEVFQSIKAEALEECPECKGKIKRLIGGGGAVLFKGSGFYQTDYPSKSYKKGKSAADKGKDKPKDSKPKKKDS